MRWNEWEGYQKCPLIFFMVFWYMYHEYSYFYIFSKIVTKILMGSKIYCQAVELGHDFQNSTTYVCFFCFVVKVRSFTNMVGHRPFFSKFDIKLGSWGLIFNSNTPADTGIFNLQGDPRLALHVLYPSFSTSSPYLPLRGIGFFFKPSPIFLCHRWGGIKWWHKDFKGWHKNQWHKNFRFSMGGIKLYGIKKLGLP